MDTSKYSFLVLNGPNLAHLGVRQPEIYGTLGMEDLPALMHRLLGTRAADVTLDFFQSNHEGAIVDRLEHVWKEKLHHGLVLNAGAYTHTSLALADCLAWTKLPFVEVHLSNIAARAEPIRHQSLIAPHAIGCISGFGLTGYVLAIQALLEHCCRETSVSETFTV